MQRRLVYATNLRSPYCSNVNFATQQSRFLNRSNIGTPGENAGATLKSADVDPLLVPFVGLLWVPFYNFAEPSLFGFPFFYWYQLTWVPVSSC